MMSGESNVGGISINSGPPSEVLSDFLTVSPGWADTMKIRLLDGRDFRSTDTNPGVALVNPAFAKQYFGGENPVGHWFEKVDSKSNRTRIQIVGLISDARSRDNFRFPIRPTVYIPFQGVAANGAAAERSRGTFVVKTAVADPLTLAPILRKTVSGSRPEFHIGNIRTQVEIIRSKTVRERLLAMLSMFFATVALLLAGVGLYGVLDYSVAQRQREIGIRLAIGAKRGHIARTIAVRAFSTISAGATVGIIAGTASARYIESLLYSVRITDPARFMLPALGIAAVAAVAALRPMIRAATIDPAKVLRGE
jgi:predicted lysophospholipase L1 biosynthesis ABC-type transport system permease subunit